MHDSRTPIHCLFLLCADAGRLYRVKSQQVNNRMNAKDYVQEIAAANTSLGSKQGFSCSFACGALSEQKITKEARPCLSPQGPKNGLSHGRPFLNAQAFQGSKTWLHGYPNAKTGNGLFLCLASPPHFIQEPANLTKDASVGCCAKRRVSPTATFLSSLRRRKVCPPNWQQAYTAVFHASLPMHPVQGQRRRKRTAHLYPKTQVCLRGSLQKSFS